MSEWKNKVKRPRVASEETYCTGWGIADGIISLISSLKKRRREKKAKRTNIE